MKFVFNHLVDNITKVTIYDNTNKTDIYLNNNSNSEYFLNLTKYQNFEEKINKYKDKIYIEYLSHKKDYSNIYYTIFFGILFILLIKYKKSISKTNSITSSKKSSIKLKDIAGLEYAKKEVFEFIDFLKNKEKYKKAGAKMPRGALFYGPPGTGKTLLAKAISGECGISFISASGPDFVEMYVGVGASRVRDLFKKARRKAPCVLFIDEIDAICRKRSNNFASSGSNERESTLNKLLIELDGFDDNDDILIFGATNRLDILDDALLRPGRFDRKIRFGLPEKLDREKIFYHYLKDKKIDGNVEDISQFLSKLSLGFSCADISNICNEACILSVRNKKDFITKNDLENAIDNVMLGPEKENFKLSDEERKIIAYHEAGHTVVSYFLENVTSPLKVSIMPRGKSALGFTQREMSDNKLKNKDELLDSISVLLGGRIAEEIFIGNITTGAYDDIQKLTELAYLFVCNYGMDEKIRIFHYNPEIRNRYSEKLKEMIDYSVRKIIKDLYSKTKKLLEDKKQYVEKIASELLRNEKLNKNDLEKLLAG